MNWIFLTSSNERKTSIQISLVNVLFHFHEKYCENIENVNYLVGGGQDDNANRKFLNQSAFWAMLGFLIKMSWLKKSPSGENKALTSVLKRRQKNKRAFIWKSYKAKKVSHI